MMTTARGAMQIGSRRAALVVIAVVVLGASLAYLRDPPWLIDMTSGLSEWKADGNGVRYRWTSGHASFFVPSGARYVVLRMRSIKDTPADWPITAAIAIDDRPAQQLTFDDEAWHALKLVLPSRGNRNVRRIDIKLSRLRANQRGLQLQAPELH